MLDPQGRSGGYLASVDVKQHVYLLFDSLLTVRPLKT